jgi:hypothetical protein
MIKFVWRNSNSCTVRGIPRFSRIGNFIVDLCDGALASIENKFLLIENLLNGEKKRSSEIEDTVLKIRLLIFWSVDM